MVTKIKVKPVIEEARITEAEAEAVRSIVIPQRSVARTAAAVTVGWGAAAAVGAIGGLLMNAALSLTAVAMSAYLTWLVIILGLGLTMFAGGAAAGYTYSYIVDGKIDRHFLKARSLFWMPSHA